MKKTATISIIFILLCTGLFAQPERIGLGLSFATKKRFNYGDTGNPGLVLKSWISVDQRQLMHIVPSFTFYNPHHVKPDPTYRTTTYMIHGDLDFQYKALQDKTLKVIAIAGFNYTHIFSKVGVITAFPGQPIDDATFGFGPNVGAALEMRMNSYWDFILTGKYSFSGIFPRDPIVTDLAPLSALVLEVQGVYYFSSRGKAYYRQ